MAIHYHVYANDGSGGPVDYATPIATVTSPAYTPAALATPSDTTFAVRAFDTVSGLEDLNTVVRRQIVIDAAGNDVSLLPAAPVVLHARALAGGSARVAWNKVRVARDREATQFKVWVTPGGAVNYAAAPSATVTANAAIDHYSVDVPGLTGGTSYQIGVRAVNAAGTEANTNSVAVVATTATPAAVSALPATVGFR